VGWRKYDSSIDPQRGISVDHVSEEGWVEAQPAHQEVSGRIVEYLLSGHDGRLGRHYKGSKGGDMNDIGVRMAEAQSRAVRAYQLALAWTDKSMDRTQILRYLQEYARIMRGA
jgi:hypothetical protein